MDVGGCTKEVYFGTWSVLPAQSGFTGICKTYTYSVARKEDALPGLDVVEFTETCGKENQKTKEMAYFLQKI